jgi:hypothetical protein
VLCQGLRSIIIIIVGPAILQKRKRNLVAPIGEKSRWQAIPGYFLAWTDIGWPIQTGGKSTAMGKAIKRA